jgi:FKBP-type peptidyl-prolyl cis-trans isomerase (trigger factor)
MEEQHQSQGFQSSNTQSSVSGGGNKKNVVIVVAALIIIGLVAVIVGNYSGSFLSGQGGQQENLEAVVAIVNDETVTRGDLNFAIDQFYLFQGIGPLEATERDVELESQILDQVIGEILLLQLAASQGVEVTEEEVQVRYDDILTQFPSEEIFALQLEELNLNMEEFLENLRSQLMIEKYFSQLAEEHNAVVTEQEIQAFFQELSSQEGFATEYEDIRDQIELTLQEQQLSDIIPGILEAFRQESTIEIRI